MAPPAVLAALFLSAPRPVEERLPSHPDDGPALVAQLEEAPADPAGQATRSALVERVRALPASGQVAFVHEAARRREALGGWRHLAPALGAIGTRGAIAELGRMARVDGERAWGEDEAVAALCSLSPALGVPELLEGCTRERGRRVVARNRTALAGLLQAEPAAWALFLSVDRARPDLERERSLGEAAGQVLSVAIPGLGDPRPVFGAATAFRSPAPLLVGLVRGIAARDPRGPHAPACEEALRFVARESDAPEVLVAAYEAVPRVLPALTAPWAGLLFPALEHPDRAVALAAWTALRRITGQQLPQATASWRGWWERQGSEEEQR